MNTSTQSESPVTADQLIQEIKAGLGQQTDLSVTRRFPRLRQMQHEIRAIPAPGNFKFIKRIIYKLNFFILVRLLGINDALIDAIEEAYDDLNRRLALQNQEIAQLWQDLERVNKLHANLPQPTSQVVSNPMDIGEGKA